MFSESGTVILEDLNSTNGTFVNGQHTTRRVLRTATSLLIGKHQLVFENTQEWSARRRSCPRWATRCISTRSSIAICSRRWTRRAPRRRHDRRRRPPRRGAVGVLQVIAGRAEQTEYDLDAHTSLIGKSEGSLVRLHGWFKPAVAVAIARSNDGYVATLMGGRTTINNEPLEKRQALQDGDVLNVNGLVLEFRWKDAVASESAA